MPPSSRACGPSCIRSKRLSRCCSPRRARYWPRRRAARRCPTGCRACARWCIVEDLDVPVGPEPPRRLLDQRAQHIDAERGVGGLQHRDLARRRVDRPVMLGREPGRADHDRRPGRDGGVEMGLERVGRGEIDQHVALRGQRRRVVAEVGAAGDVALPLQQPGDRLAHPPLGAEDADRGHRASPFLSPLHGRGARRSATRTAAERSARALRSARQFSQRSVTWPSVKKK